MDTLIFGLLLATAWVIVRGGNAGERLREPPGVRSRRTVLWLFAAGMVVTLLLFNHHVTDKLPLEF